MIYENAKWILTGLLLAGLTISTFRIGQNKYGEYTGKARMIGGFIGNIVQYIIIFYLLFIGGYYS